MLTPSRSLTLYSDTGRELPRVPGLQPLYDMEVRPRRGEVLMIAGRSGTQKSGLALWWTGSMAQQDGTTVLYFSADMSPSTASGRLASMFTEYTTEEIEDKMDLGGDEAAEVLNAVRGLPIQFSFGQLYWEKVEWELDAYVEAWDADPEVMVFDNLMDFGEAEADYSIQMNVMSNLTDLARETGAAVLVLHHATDKSTDAREAPHDPPPRSDIKNGLSEKPAAIWTVALDENPIGTRKFPLYWYKIACVKQRTGPSSPKARRFATIVAEPAITQFHARC